MILNNYLKYSSILALFSEAVQFHYLIDIRLFYAILIFNSFLLLATQSNKINRNHFWILVFLIFTGIMGVFIYKYPIKNLLAQFIGITISSLYFYNLIKRLGYEKLFKVYANFSYSVCVIGLIMFYFGITIWDPERLHSILLEPSRFVIIVLPAVYFFYHKKKYFKFTVILISLIFAQSAIGFIGLLLFLILPNLKIRVIKKLIYFLPIALVFIWYLSKNEKFQRRFTQTLESIKVFETKEFDKNINLSSYALLSNSYVSFNNFIDHPLGTGLGSFKTRYEYYISDLKVPLYIEMQNLQDLNSDDANSLLLRMVSDFGIIGIIGILYFCFFCLKSFKFNSYESIIAQSLVIYFFLKLLRQGHYFPEELYFFLWIFIFAYKEAKNKYKILNEN